jgi:nucleotide-binding universal stress UspA family protein
LLKPCILAGTDLTLPSRLPAQRAQRMARELGMRFVLAHVTPGFSTQSAESLTPSAWMPKMGAPTSQQGSRALATAAKLATGRFETWMRKARVEPDAERVAVGAPHRVLLAVAKSNKAALIVTGVHRPTSKAESFLLGSTTDRLLRQSPIPVMLVRGSARSAYKSVLVALDLGDTSQRIIAAARRFFPNARLHLVHVSGEHPKRDPLHEQRMRNLHEKLDALAEAAGLTPEQRTTKIVQGAPRKVILREAARRAADVIVVGTRARKGLERLLLGSIAEYVLRAAEMDVLAVPPS